MKKNTQNTATTTTTTAAPVAQPTTQEPQQEQRPDFYARLLTERPNEAASIMATLNRRKDFALRLLADHLKRGRDVNEAMSHAMSIAFPKHKEAAA